jgi:hypothetical protein
MSNLTSIRILMTFFLILSVLIFPNTFVLAQTCDPVNGDSAQVLGYQDNVNLNLGDYGRIFQDAAQPTNSAAWISARDALIRKIESTIAAGSHYDGVLNKTVGPYQGWLEGANVSLIMASGLLLSASNKQQLTRPLDSAIRRAIGSYVFNRDAGCGFSDGRWQGQNNCMDDYAVAATGFAWIAAYKYKRGDSGVSYYVNAANNAITSALGLEESVCAYPSGSSFSFSPTSARGPCTATVADLRNNVAETVSLNHGQQTIAYGMGLMTSISSAFIGLQTANANPSLTPDQKDVALALFKEAQAQNHTATDGSTFVAGGCYALRLDLTGFQTIAHCGDVGGGYKPKMFPVKTFYQVLGLTVPTAGYQFDVFDPNLFLNPVTGVWDAFYNNGRFVVYRDLTMCWWSVRPSLGDTQTQPLSEIAFVKPSYASWGPADTLTVAGWARNGPSGVELRWRDVTTGGAEQVVSFQPTPGADTSWSNTLPSSNYCHDYEVYVNYAGSSSNIFMYSGLGSGYCPEVARLGSIQPQSLAGPGPAGSLAVAGFAANAPAGTTVKLYWRDLSLRAPSWNLVDSQPLAGADGSWSNSIANADYSHVYELYAKYDAFASRTCRYNGNQLLNQCEVNFAAPSAGATVTASSTYSASYPVSAVNNGDRKGINWGNGGGWNDATPDSYPDSVEVDFTGAKTIDQINVFTLQDNIGSPIEPVEALTFSNYGLRDFSVEYWDASAGTWKRVPGANAISNNKVWMRFLFSPLTTSKIRVLVTGALASFSRITEIEAWGVPASKFNYASDVKNGAHTSNTIASSTYSAGFPAAAVIDGDRKGMNWASGGGWNDATVSAFPDSIEIDFQQVLLNGTLAPVSRTIDTINVFTLQDNYGSPADPTETMTFSSYGITAFDVQYFDGFNWVTVPGGSVSGNSNVWRKFTFAAVTTDRIRIVVNNALAGYSRITEVEALGF